MATANVSLRDGKSVMIVVRQGSTCAAKTLGITVTPDQWDNDRRRVIGHPKRSYFNMLIKEALDEYQNAIYQLNREHKLRKMTASDIIKHVNGEPTKKNAFRKFYLEFLSRKEGRTREIYDTTLRRLEEFDKDIDDRTIDEIDVDYLTQFDRYMTRQSPSVNARGIHLRNIRAVYNDAINAGIADIREYPFRRFKIKKVATRKRALSATDIRLLGQSAKDPVEQKYIDLFNLIFCLIGINMIDLYGLEKITSDGYVEYYRRKTGRAYRIKVEPEAMAIINKYRGTTKLLKICERVKHHESLTKQMNKALKRIGMDGSRKSKALFPDISVYWARHSWATIASRLDVPKDVIAAALGHGKATVTDIYIDYDEAKIDAANRLVLDYVFGEKRKTWIDVRDTLEWF